MSESLFTGQTPSTTDASDGTPGISTATTVQVAVDGTISAIRFYATATKGGTYTAELWLATVADDDTPAGTLLVTKAASAAAITAGTWNTIAFDTPVAVTPGHLYRCVLHNNQGRYVATTGFFTSAGLTNGNLTAYQNGTDPNPPGLGGMRQGSFRISAAAGSYPNLSGSGTCYFVDLVFTPSTVVDGSVAVNLGGLTLTAAGHLTVHGTVVAALGGLSVLAMAFPPVGAGTPITVRTTQDIHVSQTPGGQL